jgi:hypothetical protein
MDIAEITNGISAALTADEMVDQAQVANLKTAQTYLSSEAIQPTALSFYRT